MSEVFELEQLRKQLMNPELPSGLYLLDTDLTDEEIEGAHKRARLLLLYEGIVVPAVKRRLCL